MCQLSNNTTTTIENVVADERTPLTMSNSGGSSTRPSRGNGTMYYYYNNNNNYKNNINSRSKRWISSWFLILVGIISVLLVTIQPWKKYNSNNWINSKKSLVEDENRYVRRFDISTTTTTSVITAPVFGVLTQPWYKKDGEEQMYYIAGSYIKWLEAGGIRTIPIPYDANTELIDDLFTQINGLFLPGGGCDLPYALSYLFEKIVDSNINQQIYFPVWGTCLGFEFIVQYFGIDPSEHNYNTSVVLETGYEAENISLPLYNVQQREIYTDTSIYNIVTNYNVTMNNHELGISPNKFLSNEYLNKLFYITSTNVDEKTAKEFVSTIEPRNATQFPIYGVQYHPEKNTFEYATYPGTDIPYEAIDHSANGIELSLYLAEFVGQLGRRAVIEQQQQRNATNHAYTKSDLYPIVPKYPSITGTKFEQIFILPGASHFNQTSSSSDTTIEK